MLLPSPEKKPLDSPEFIFVGDHPALDFANTFVPPPGPGIDFLRTWTDVAAWFGQTKLATEASLHVTSGQQAEALQEVTGFRDQWREQIGGLLRGRKVSEKFLQSLNSRLEPDLYHEMLHRDNGKGFHLSRSPSPLHGKKLALALLARQIALFLSESNLDHLRRCANTHSCVLYFQDTTKNHRRQWCSVATCGNRHKAAEFRRRQGKARNS